MFKVEAAANYIADKLSAELKYNDERKEVIAYGAFALFQTLLSIILVIVFGWVFDVIIEAIIISFSVSILRKYSGGIHATSSDACVIIGTIVFIVLAKVVSLLGNLHYIDVMSLLFIGAAIWCYYIAFKLAPVESAAKKLSLMKKKRMKKGTIITLSVYVLLELLFTVLYYFAGYRSLLLYSLCISAGSTWQMFTLTRLGHIYLCKVDKLFNYILNFGGN